MRNIMLRIRAVSQAIECGVSASHDSVSKASSLTPIPTLTFDAHSSPFTPGKINAPTLAINAYLQRTLDSNAVFESTANNV